MKKWIESYCVGCGLCEALGKAKCEENDKGFLYPVAGDEEWLEGICPAGGRQQRSMNFDNIWGKNKKIYVGWSCDNQVRQASSSGGVITEICCWMIKNKYADAILHTCVDESDPTKTVCCESSSITEIQSRCGSRYSISHPLGNVTKIETSKKYVFVGKPCDIVALKNLEKLKPEIKKNIVLTISFLCAGLPSVDAQTKLLNFLKCEKGNLLSLRYRGDGWPGYTIAIDKDGKEYQTDYNSSWGGILGRDIMKMCRFCLDGIGELADVSCGDAWCLNENKKPDFSESQGRNIIFARTEIGQQIIENMNADKSICLESMDSENLKFMQSYQWERRATMIGKVFALKLFGKPVPQYLLRNIFKYAKEVSFKKHLRIFLGTIKRIIRGKI